MLRLKKVNFTAKKSYFLEGLDFETVLVSNKISC